MNQLIKDYLTVIGVPQEQLDLAIERILPHIDLSPLYNQIQDLYEDWKLTNETTNFVDLDD